MHIGGHRRPGPGGPRGFRHGHGRPVGFGHGPGRHGGFGHRHGGPGIFGHGPGRFYRGPRVFRHHLPRRGYGRPGGCLGCLTFLITAFAVACGIITTLLILI